MLILCIVVFIVDCTCSDATLRFLSNASVWCCVYSINAMLRSKGISFSSISVSYPCRISVTPFILYNYESCGSVPNKCRRIDFEKGSVMIKIVFLLLNCAAGIRPSNDDVVAIRPPNDGDDVVAIRACNDGDDAVETRPSNEDVVESLLKEGDELFEADHWAQALEKYDMVLELDGTSQLAMRALFNRAIAKRNLDQYEEAIVDYGRVIDGTESMHLCTRSYENRAAARCQIAREEDVAPAFDDLTRASSLLGFAMDASWRFRLNFRGRQFSLSRDVFGVRASMQEEFQESVERIPRVRGTFRTQ